MKRVLLWLCPLVIVYCIVSCGRTSQSNLYFDDEGVPFKGISSINDFTEVALDSTETALLMKEIDSQKMSTPKTDMVVLILPQLPASPDGGVWTPMGLAESVIEKWELDSYDSSAILLFVFTKTQTEYIVATKNIAHLFNSAATQFIFNNGVDQHYRSREYAKAIGFTINNAYAVATNTYTKDTTSSARTAYAMILIFVILIAGTLIEIRISKIGGILAGLVAGGAWYVIFDSTSMNRIGVATAIFLFTALLVILTGNTLRPPKVLR